MFQYTPAQIYTMQQHQNPYQQAVYAHRQQQEANLLYQYNQLRSFQAAYSNPAIANMAYGTTSLEPQQTLFRPDQLVPQTPVPIATPVQQHQLQQQVQQLQQIQSSSPINALSLSAPDGWLANNPVAQNFFRPLTHAMSRQMLDMISYHPRTNSTSSNPPNLPMSSSFELPSTISYQLQQKATPPTEEVQRRQRLHSGSSCYESDSSDVSNAENDEFEWRQANTRQLPGAPPAAILGSQSNLMGRLDVTTSEKHSHDIYQKLSNNNGVFPSINTTYHAAHKNNNGVSRPKLIQYMNDSIIGKDHIFTGPWGPRRMIYCDYTASGRPLTFIEDYIKSEILPLYGNTHSETSLCAQQSTRFREEARNLIKKSVNANENDALLFTGTGSTGAVHALVDNFNFHDENNRKNTVVMVSAFEHHSNILPWSELGLEMVRIPTTQHGVFDQAFLKEKLQHYKNLKKRIICSFNAVSNITGIYTDVDAVSTLVHSYSGLIFWDYATGAPYVKIDMNPSSTAYKDGIFISPHKFLGGPGTPGVLIIKKNLFSLKPPSACGGGTVNFVTRTRREYNYDIEIREEGGTPDIVGCIRAGLVFQLKDALDVNYMKAREEELVKRFVKRFKNHKTLINLGSSTAERLPIFSFVIYIPSVCKYLHHNLACLLFNDLFGIQVRSGCACAGPYALDLLNINDAKTDTYCKFMTEDSCARGNDNIVRTMMMKPGFTRLNLPYFVNDDEIEYILNAVEFIATEGWKFIPLYTFDPVTASWSHRSGFQLAQSSLEDITYRSGKMHFNGKKTDSSSGHAEKNLSDPFRDAKLIAADAARYALESIDYSSDPPLNVPEKYSNMVWFALPMDIVFALTKQQETGQEPLCDVNFIPFIPDDAKKRITETTQGKVAVVMREKSLNRKKNGAKRHSSIPRFGV